MTEKKYAFPITRFHCGCVYRTVDDTAVFCPQHDDPPHRGAIIGKETVYASTPDPPEIPNLVFSQGTQGNPETLMNTGQNSLHVQTTVYDNRGMEWSMPEDEQVGLCAACLVDNEDCYETRIYRCECRSEECTYRWCGNLSGLHAFWRLHAQGRSDEVADIHELDIFGFGSYQDLSEETNQILDAERDALNDETERLLLEMTQARKQNDAGDEINAMYLIPWLDEEYEVMNDPQHREADRRVARTALGRKLLRLMLIGALPANEAADADSTAENDTEPQQD